MSTIQDLTTLLSSLTESEQAKIIPKLMSFTTSDSQPFSKSGQTFTPEYHKMDIVHCDFTGVGFEWDGGHYAVVWDVNPVLDSIMVIPTTSQPRKEHANVFSVGQVSGLPQGTTTLLVSDMTRVSRKRLGEIRWTNPTTGISKKVTLPYSWTQRISEAMAVTYGNEIQFGDYLADNFGVAMVADLVTLHQLKYKPVKCHYDPATRILTYRLWNEATLQTLQLVNPNPGMFISRKDKQIIVRGLLSHNSARRSQAEAEYKRLYH